MIRTLGSMPLSTTIEQTAATTLIKLAPATGPAAPFVAAAAGVAELLSWLGIGGGCGETCIYATQIANQHAEIQDQIHAQYFALPAPRTKTQQANALADWKALEDWFSGPQGCGNPELGDAGKRCVAEDAVPTGQYFGYGEAKRLEIANDPVIDDTTPAESLVRSYWPVLLIAAGLGMMLWA